MLINVKMPTIVGILTFMSRINFSLSLAEYDFITSEPGLWGLQPTKSDTKRSLQPQKARGLKFQMKEEEGLYYL